MLTTLQNCKIEKLAEILSLGSKVNYLGVIWMDTLEIKSSFKLNKSFNFCFGGFSRTAYGYKRSFMMSLLLVETIF